MPTNLALDADLLAEAHELGGHRTQRETVDEALREYIARRQRLASIRAFGTFDFDPDFGHERERRKR